MCYSISQMKQKSYKAALREGAPQAEIDRLYNEWQESQRIDTEDDQQTPMAYLSGYDHPKLFTLIHTDNWHATRFEWGLIPAWTKNEGEALKIRTKTLNARGETIFEKASFREAARHKRCLVFVDGFFEYHHKNGQSFPYFIRHKKENKPFVFGALWSEWLNPSSGKIHRTTSLVTTKANDMMREIHNNPKLNEARMPLILHPSDTDAWLKSTNEKEVKALIQPYAAEQMESYTVRRLIGSNGIGDTPSAVEPYVYPEQSEQGTLF